jgi:5-methylcytosine-specific restriction endonuclease McrA
MREKSLRNNIMANKFRIPKEIEEEIRKRDENCVYCKKPMISPWQSSNRRDSATIEHLREIKPFYWTDETGLRTSLKKEELAICCGACNSSRGKKKIRSWLQKKNIDETTVADVVKEYIRKYESLNP